MTDYGIPILYTLFLWWFSTGAILFLDGLPRKTYPFSVAGWAVLYVFALWGLSASSRDMTVFGAYCTFTCGLLVWGLNEITFLMGYVTGPRTEPCPPGCKGFRHFLHAVQTILYHELGIVASAVLVTAMTWGEPNQIGTWTFLILWAMRLSTKLNIFLGVPNLTEEFLPEHLAYMKGFFRKRPMNWLFPWTVTASTVVATALVMEASRLSATDPHQAAGLTFVATLMGLAILEHWFLVLPMSVVPLWRWGLKSRVWFRRLDPRRNGSRRASRGNGAGRTPAPAAEATVVELVPQSPDHDPEPPGGGRAGRRGTTPPARVRSPSRPVGGIGVGASIEPPSFGPSARTALVPANVSRRAGG
ncbi:hypothetical protein A33M_1570 [Rhodovulum sp. PH10]|uniref:putative photosynthetic complex assembly protein PuhE n=1 Tax=Rhodovulum sp. PH10 TaxID=1187851 RepID=UPI00027C1FD7|nr:putative photosynthetic complex assembly protein PuhE [Rhodovulum sp. PH10]EJW12781.1 hypothetical protein A33M_1570 [Rhodovulum sp. PH10]